MDVSKGLTVSHMASPTPNPRDTHATAVTYDEQNFKVTVVYNDHSVYVWDVRDIKKVRKCVWVACMNKVSFFPSSTAPRTSPT